MSKIKSKLVIPLQEIAEELGFSTIQDALDNGYHVVEDMVTGDATLKKLSIDEQYEQAHEAWLKEKREALEGLKLLMQTKYLPSLHKRFIERAVNFIEGVSHE